MNYSRIKKEDKSIGSLNEKVIDFFFSEGHPQLFIFKVAQGSRFTVLLKNIEVVF